ncbi:hypothetical protein C4579_04090 [Candidatus Microgenomates bacterium]|nr:MAG: hypothetical protein C4579_04090 [Candidatus Microgenomates bacterium]
MAKIAEVPIFGNGERKNNMALRPLPEFNYAIDVDFRQYGRRGVSPPLDFGQLSLRFTSSDERLSSGIHVGGHASFILSYKQQSAFLMSFKIQESDLWIVQMQGGKKRGYRVQTGMHTTALFADQTRELITHPDNTEIHRVILPHYTGIAGLDYEQESFVGRRGSTQNRYDQLSVLLGMEFNPDMNAFVLDTSSMMGVVQ